MPSARRSTGPGRVNLIGDHTDYNLGVALPMAIGLGVTAELVPSTGSTLRVTSASFPEQVAEIETADAELGRSTPPWSFEPAWARPVAAMVRLVRPGPGSVHLESDLPIGAGLSSSAALCTALADLFGVEGSAVDIARLCQKAERLAGAPVGAMDPLVCAGGRAGHALLIDFAVMTTRQVGLPPDAEVVVVDSGRARTVAGSAYAQRVSECTAASELVGPLGAADEASVATIADRRLRRRARHVVSECARVHEFAAALRASELVTAGCLMNESHRSLAEDFAVSTPEMDQLVTWVRSRKGVFGARMTGAGFGGCVVALARPGAIDPASLAMRAWRVEAVDGTLASRRRGSALTAGADEDDG